MTNKDKTPVTRLDHLNAEQRRLLILRLDRRLSESSRDEQQTNAAAHVIRPIARFGDLPLSPSQRSLWLSDQLAPGLPNYNMPLTLLLRGPLNEPEDMQRMERALNAVVARHEPLRSSFHFSEDKPVQRPAQAAAIRLAVSDLREYTPVQREIAVEHLYRESCLEPMDLERGVLFRAGLILLRPRESLLLLNLHHIVCDGPSFQVLLNEFREYYEAPVEQAEAKPPLSITYGDFAVWQFNQLSGNARARAADRLGPLLKDLPPSTFPTDNTRPAHSLRGTGCVHFFTTAREAAEVRRVAGDAGGTAFSAYLAAFHLLQYRYSGRTDQAVTSVMDARSRSELDGLIGSFINPIVMRANLEGRPNFKELIHRVRDFAADMREMGDVPFTAVLDELALRDARTGLPPVFFQVLSNPLRKDKLGALTMEPVFYGGGLTRFDVEFHLFPSDSGIRGLILYNRDLYADATIRGMAEHYCALLRGLARRPELPVQEIPMQSRREIRESIARGVNRKGEFARDALVHELFDLRARENPDAAALVHSSGTLSYGEIRDRSRDLSLRLRQAGVQREARVGILLERSPELIISMLAILRAGGAYVPLDPAYPPARLRFMAHDAGISVLVTNRPDAGELLRFEGPAVNPDEREKHSTAPHAKMEHDASEQASDLSPLNLAYLMYTSGSSGVPRGVAITHGNIIRLTQGANYSEPAREQVTAQLSSISFDASTFEIWLPLTNGGRLVIPPPGPPTPEEIERAVDQDGVTTLWLTAGLFHQLVETDTATLRKVPRLMAGGDVVSAVHVRRVLENAKDRHFINGYGPTENTTFTTHFAVGSAEEVPVPLPIGRPIAHTDVYLLDRDFLPVPTGVPGEVFIAGEGLARGYFGDPALTAEKFLPNPFARKAGERMYRSGDMARRLPDGNLQFLGRLDNQVKINGFRVEPAEIEAELHKHPAVARACVLATYKTTPDSANTGATRLPAGMPRRELSAYIVPRKRETGSEPVPEPEQLRADLVRGLSENLPHFMMPAEFHLLDELPLTENGKVDRHALLAREIIPYTPEKEYVAPSTPMEKRLAVIWNEVLGREDSGIHDDFFRNGGDSMKAIRLRSEIRNRLGREVPLSVFFQSPDIARLAEYLKVPVTRLSHSPLVNLRSGGSRPPFFCVHPLGGTVLCYIYLARQLGDDQPFYAFQAPGMESGESMLFSVEDMAARYLEAMRTVQGEGPYHLGGWSFGGLVAYEMARILRAQGESVALLAILDTIPPAGEGAGAFSPGHFIVHLGGLLTALAGRGFQSYDDIWQMARILGINLPPPCDLMELEFEEVMDYARDIMRDMPRIMAVAAANFLSGLRYAPPPQPGEGLLVRAEENPMPAENDPFAAGWSRLLNGGLEVQRAPGAHLSMLDRHHAPALGERLKMWLARTRWVQSFQSRIIS